MRTGMFLGYENEPEKPKEISEEEKDRLDAEKRSNQAALAAGSLNRPFKEPLID